MNADAQALLDPWPGPYGGLPPWGRVTPAALEDAFRAAVDAKRAEVAAIAADAEPPTFANTVAALESAGRALDRLQTLLSVCANTMATGDMPAVAARLAPLVPALDDATAHDERLFARVGAVWQARNTAGLDAEQRRLVEVLHARFLRRGAALPAPARERLAAINGRIAALSARFAANLQHDEQAIVWIDDPDALDGCNGALRQALARAAADACRDGAWGVRNMRALVWPFLTQSTRRDLRERVWRMWNDRGGHAGAHDNRPLVAELLALRGDKARLLGHASYAELALAERMARTPGAAEAMLRRTWQPVRAATLRQIAAYQAVADAEGAGHALQPWDRLHYAEKLRRQRFGFDSEALRAYLSLDNVLQALFWLAGRLHGLAFEPVADAPLLDPTMRAYALRRGGEPVGVLYFDLHARPGKGHGSYQAQWRGAESHAGRVLPISCITSNLPRPADGEPTLLAWEYANVLFHEFGHALHILSSRARYPSLGPLHVAWDFIELPSLMTENWLRERDLLARFARHWQTGEAVPAALLDALEASLRHDRIFSVNLDYLAPALLDLRLHRMDAGGGSIDVEAVERDVLTELGMPDAWDLVMRVPNLWHVWAGEHYAAGLYVYLWADVMAADAAEAFAAAPGGWYDADVAQRWRERVLAVASTVPAEQAFRDFRGRDPDPDALLRRFGLLDPA